MQRRGHEKTRLQFVSANEVCVNLLWEVCW